MDDPVDDTSPPQEDGAITGDAIAQPVKGINWLLKMDEYLNWKIVGPDINNPYAAPLSTATVASLAREKDALKKLFVLRCLCEGYEVLLVRNLTHPSIETDHPCLSGMSKQKLFEFLGEKGISEKIEAEVDRVQQEFLDELSKRETVESKESKKKKKEKKEKKEDKGSSDNSKTGYRVIRG